MNDKKSFLSPFKFLFLGTILMVLMMLSRERKSVVDIMIIYAPAAAFRYPAPRPYVYLFPFKIQGYYMIGVYIPQAFFTIKAAGSHRNITTAGNGKQFPYFHPVNMTVEMNDTISFHKGGIIFVFVFRQPVDRVMSRYGRPQRVAPSSSRRGRSPCLPENVTF